VNYLAHFHLARGDDSLIAGALLGDFVKGPLAESMPLPLRRGIELHRQVDALSDRHPLRAQFARKLPDNYRRYAGILLDVCCDHWLSRHWSAFEPRSLGEFSARIYAVLQSTLPAMSPAAARMAQRLIEHDVLARYDDVAVIASTIERIGWRLRRDNPLRSVGAELPLYLNYAEPVFIELYPQLLAQVDAVINAG
jgi:acyl carrier protein phosphodiesterase